MSRTVIRINPYSSGGAVFFLESPANIPYASMTCKLNSAPGNQPFAGFEDGSLIVSPVKTVGLELLKDLQRHQGVNAALQSLLGTLNQEATPLYFRVEHPDSGTLPWEALFNGTGFFALDPRWPIARVVDAVTPSRIAVRGFEPPLRVVAALSAIRIGASREWEALRDGLLGTEPVDLTVLVAEPALAQAITAENLPNVKVDRLQSKEHLLKILRDTRPHVVHFFCHGSEPGSTPHLRMATPADYAANTESVLIEAGDLAPLQNVDNEIWFLGLNACSAGAGKADTRSLAEALVQAGFPAVLAMRDRIKATEAHRFCRSFYELFVKEIGRLARTKATQEIDWTKFMHAPRCALRDMSLKDLNGDLNGKGPADAACEFRQWVTPILYVRPESFRVSPPSTNAVLSDNDKDSRHAELEILRTALETMKLLREIPVDVVVELQTRVDKIEAELYPK